MAAGVVIHASGPLRRTLLGLKGLATAKVVSNMAAKKAKPAKGVRGRVVAAKAAAAARAVKAAAVDIDAEVEDAIISGVADAVEVNVATSCVKMKLASFCPDHRIRRLLGSVVREFNVVLAEAYAFANFVFQLRCFALRSFLSVALCRKECLDFAT